MARESVPTGLANRARTPDRSATARTPTRAPHAVFSSTSALDTHSARIRRLGARVAVVPAQTRLARTIPGLARSEFLRCAPARPTTTVHREATSQMDPWKQDAPNRTPNTDARPLVNRPLARRKSAGSPGWRTNRVTPAPKSAQASPTRGMPIPIHGVWSLQKRS